MGRPINIGDLMKVVFGGMGAAQETQASNRQTQFGQGVNIAQLLGQQEDRTARVDRNAMLDERYDENQAYNRDQDARATNWNQFKYTHEGAADAMKPEKGPRLDDLLNNSLVEAVQSGKITIEDAYKYKKTITGSGKDSKPTKPSIVPSSIRGSASVSFPGGGGMGANLIGINPVTGAMDVPQGRQLDPTAGARIEAEKAKGAAKAQPQAEYQLAPKDYEIATSIQGYLRENPNMEIDWEAVKRDNPDVDIDYIKEALGIF